MVDLTVDPVIKAYLFYATIVLAKTMLMSFLTGMTRMKKKVFANPEDAKMGGAKIKFDDVDVERVRRCHLNDIENVYVFVMLGALYCAINPSYTTALWHFRIFAASRIAHTIVYVGQVPQPSRGIAFTVGAVVCISMIVRILVSVF